MLAPFAPAEPGAGSQAPEGVGAVADGVQDQEAAQRAEAYGADGAGVRTEQAGRGRLVR
jgi:hypothetical protein